MRAINLTHWLAPGDAAAADSGLRQLHRRFYDEYNAVLDMPVEYYKDTIRVVFQLHLPPRGLWDVAGERVDPSRIGRTALLTSEGELDDISGQGQTSPALTLCTGIDEADHAYMTVEGAGHHYGIFSGRRWRTKGHPRVRVFIGRYAT